MTILDRFRLDGRVALVTGSSHGIGRAIALAFAEAGADVLVSGRTPEDVDAVAAEITALGRRAVAAPADVMDDDALVGLVDRAVGELGRLDVAVNNAGGTPPRAAVDTSAGFMERAFRFNAVQPFLLAKAAARAMVDTAGEGAVLNISSRSSQQVVPGFVAYGTAKAALNKITTSLAVEWAPRVRVNAISVGAVSTRALEVVMTDDGLKRTLEDGTPMGRAGDPEDIAAAALWLCSPAGAWVTGKVVEVDGGAETTVLSLPTPPLEPSDQGRG
jgi:7-alpha-hydroxysteroid dehydrogenase